MNARNANNGEVAGGMLSLRGWYLEAEAAAGIARQLAPTSFVPQSLKRYYPDEKGEPTNQLDLDATVPVVTAVLLAGQELGLKPMASLRSFDEIGGVPAMRANAQRALVQAHGHDIWVVEQTATRAIVRGQRSDGEPMQSVWTIDRARQMGIAGRLQWRLQPAAMLVARATAEMARWIDADGLLGIPERTAEELLDELEGDAEPARKKVRRPANQLALPPPSQPGDDQAADDGTRRAVRKIARAQSDRMHGAFRALDLPPDKALKLIAEWVEHPVDKTSNLTYAEATRVLTKLDEMQARQQQNHAAETPPPEPPDER